jgi:hypothetical protein
VSYWAETALVPDAKYAARPAATWGTACVRDPGAAHGSTARRRAARRRRCSASRRRHGAGARETAGNGGSPARRRRRGVMTMGERRARRSGRYGGGPGDGAVGEDGCRKASGASEAVERGVTRSGGGRCRRRRRHKRRGVRSGGREVCYRDALSAISELKFTRRKLAQIK